MLEGLLRWLRKFLQRPEADLLDFVAEAMYSGKLSEISLEQARLVREFLAALKRTAGPHHHLAVLRQATHFCTSPVLTACGSS